MNFDEYQERSKKTAIYPNIGNNVVYPTLGLCGEAGEVAEHVSKSMRDDDGYLLPARRISIGKELGDCLWEIAQIATELELNLNDIAERNIEKLEDRQERGVLGGSGGER